MSKTVVIYKSKYGCTKKYAEAISKSLNADLFEHSKIKADSLIQYDNIVYGAGLYASGINGISLITKNFPKLKDKNLIVFTVGLSSTEDKDIFKPIISKNFTDEMKSSIEFFHLRGGIDYKELSFLHKNMMVMMKKSVEKKKETELTEDDRQMLETYGEKVDFTDLSTIEPLVSYVKSCS